MANIKSSIKRVRTSENAQTLNIAQKNAMRTAVKQAEAAKTENADNKSELISKAVKLVDKANKTNQIHANKASRLKSKLMAN